MPIIYLEIFDVATYAGLAEIFNFFFSLVMTFSIPALSVGILFKIINRS